MKGLKRIAILVIALFTCPLLSISQISFGGQPHNWDSISKKDIGICGKYIAPPDLEEILLQDSINDLNKSKAYRFGIENNVQLNNENSGVNCPSETLLTRY